MGRRGGDLQGAALFDDGGRAVAQGAGGIDHVVYQNDLFPLHVADNVHDLAHIGPLPPLIDDCQRTAKPGSEIPGTGHRA